MINDFCVFILSHGRPDNVKTVSTLSRHGYTGKVYIIIDNEDKTASDYYKNFGDKVIMFDKLELSKTFDSGDNFDNRKTIVYARNACWEIARKLGIKYFVQLDDDYYWFGHRAKEGGKSTRRLDLIFIALVNFLLKTNISSVALSQGGDHIGGYDEKKQISRKAMNSFVCITDRPFTFLGRINEDVNTYVCLGGIGFIFFTIMNIQLDQNDTQSNSGGMVDVYNNSGTYVKSFYTVMYCPSCVKIKKIGIHHSRLHHSISWGNAVPCIIREKYKKSPVVGEEPPAEILGAEPVHLTTAAA
jgi:hypothetical protein